jgi:hypothetical protein
MIQHYLCFVIEQEDVERLSVLHSFATYPTFTLGTRYVFFCLYVDLVQMNIKFN